MLRYILLIFTFSFVLNATDFKALLFNGNCTTCHFINKAVSAPSMKEVQKVYKNAFPNKSDFISYMANWVKEPNKKGSLMHNAIDKYELMPEMVFDQETLYDIAEYIYDMR